MRGVKGSAPMTGAGPWVTACVAGASCWGTSDYMSTKLGMRGVYMCIHQKISSSASQQAGDPWVRAELSVGWGVCAGIQGDL